MSPLVKRWYPPKGAKIIICKHRWRFINFNIMWCILCGALRQKNNKNLGFNYSYPKSRYNLKDK